MRTIVALFYLIAALAANSATQNQDQAISAARTQLSLGDRSEYKLIVPGEQREVVVHISDPDPQQNLKFSKAPDGSWQAGFGVGRIIVPLALRSAFSSNPDGEVVLELSLWSQGKTNLWRFASTGPAEAIYALRCLSPERKWAERFAEKVPKTRYVTSLTSDLRKDVMTIAHETSVTDPDLLKLVSDSFDAHRAETLAQYSRSLLFYPRAGELSWNFRQTGDELYAISGCSDRMFSATFVVRIDRKKDGNWAFRQIYANEWFKGE